ncbi:hypothetical protein DK058_25990, partial [Salmonella enterica subsp. enterica serovar Typhi]|nr:hypothetical protein [Salmonella enterica subsp. enterica serovar Typhi]
MTGLSIRDGSPGGGPAPAANLPFNRSVMAFLDRTEYRRCEDSEDVEAVLRFRYNAYRSQARVTELATGKVTDRLDHTPNCQLFAIYLDGRMVSTLRLHHSSAALPDGPAMNVFPDIVGPMLERGESYVQPSQFTADPEAVAGAIAIPYLTMRLTALATVHHGATGCAGIIRREHSSFYHRLFEAEQVGDARPFPPFTDMVMLYMANSAASLERVLDRFSFLRSTSAERR